MNWKSRAFKLTFARAQRLLKVNLFLVLWKFGGRLSAHILWLFYFGLYMCARKIRWYFTKNSITTINKHKTNKGCGFNTPFLISDVKGERMKARYRVHRFDIDMTKDQRKLEQFLNSLEGEVVAIIPSVNPKYTVRGATATVDFLLVVEKSE